jgi:tRNA(Ile2)-agmatinylcytidine synthase
MAYEPTKNFRQIVRHLVPGDDVIAVGSFKKGSINIEKLKVDALSKATTTRPPICTSCNKRMTSNGKGKGYKCRKCRAHATESEIREISRTIKTGWYEVPPTARRHLAKPLCRGEPDL